MSNAMSLAMSEEIKDIIAGLEQRIRLYKTKLHDLQRKLERVEGEVKTTTKYLELAETLYRVEVEKAKSPLQGGGSAEGERKGGEVGDPSQIILLERTKYAGLSVPQAALLLFKERGGAIHAKEIYRQLEAGGMRIRGKTPVTSVSTSLSRDRRFRKSSPNTYQLVEEAGSQTSLANNP